MTNLQVIQPDSGYLNKLTCAIAKGSVQHAHTSCVIKVSLVLWPYMDLKISTEAEVGVGR